MRLVGEIPFEAIGDETRPFIEWDVHDDPGAFVAKEIDDFLKNYYRNLLRSQPNHVEVVVEKNTVAGIVKAVVRDFTMKMTSGRGYCSLPPRHAMAQRFRKSGKEKLVVLLVTDFDPDGEEIAASFGRSMRDDFNIGSVHPIKVALTSDQVEEYRLPPVMQAKGVAGENKRRDGFVEKYGTNVWELEALDPTDLQDIVRKAIVSVLDMDAFEREQLAEQNDAVRMRAIRETVQEALKDVRFDTDGVSE